MSPHQIANWQVFADGKQLAILMPDNQSVILKHLMPNALTIETPTISYGDEFVRTGPTEARIEIMGYVDAQKAHVGEVLDLQFVHTMTVRELFEAIRKKIEKR